MFLVGVSSVRYSGLGCGEVIEELNNNNNNNNDGRIKAVVEIGTSMEPIVWGTEMTIIIITLLQGHGEIARQNLPSRFCEAEPWGAPAPRSLSHAREEHCTVSCDTHFFFFRKTVLMLLLL